MGERVFLQPRVPECRSDEECSITKRICVSPTVEQCLLGIQGCDELYQVDLCDSGWYVYEYKGRTKPKRVTEEMVCDSGITEEHWILKEEPFTFLGVVNYLDENYREVVVTGFKDGVFSYLDL